MKKILFSILLFCCLHKGNAQNVGIGTTTPQANLHVNGTFKLLNGVVVNGISADTTFSNSNDSLLTTQKAIKKYVQKGAWAPVAPSTVKYLKFADSTSENIGASPTGIFAAGNYVYSLVFTSSRLCIFDVSNPANIVSRGFTSTNLYIPVSVYVQGNYAYVASRGNSRLCIFDISNPDAIVAKGFISTNLSAPKSVKVQGNYAYLVSDLGLSIYDISNPDAIVARGVTNTNLVSPQALCVQGNYAYVASRGNNNLCIFDITDPNAIVPKAFVNVGAINLNTVDVEGNFAYVAGISGGNILRYNISNPDNIAVAGASPFIGLGIVSVRVKGNYVFAVSDNDRKLSVVDFSIQFAARLYDSRNFVSNFQDLLDGYLFVTDNACYVAMTSPDKLFVYTFKAGDKALSLDTAGNISYIDAPWQTNNENGIDNIYTMRTRVGIGLSIPSSTLHIAGQVTATGYITASDLRYKSGIGPLVNPLHTLQQLTGVSYFFNKQKFPGYEFPDQLQYGFIAQEVEKVLPNIVSTGKDGFKAVNYQQVIPLLTESIKIQQQQIELLQQQIDELKKMIKN